MKNKTYVIAEAGVNHNGSITLAKTLIDIAKDAGADAIKFQTFKADKMVTKTTVQADYQIDNLKEETSQYEMLKKLELTYSEFALLKSYCNERGIDFLSTPFEEESVDYLIDELKINRIKIPSGELTNAPFIHYLATKRLPIIMSTGMATLDEIHEALSIIAFGLSFPNKEVNLKEVELFYESNEAKETLLEYVTVLHCTTSYPTPVDEVNLKSMDYLKEKLAIRIGFSDHSQGILASVLAVAKGAEIIEKHFTISRFLSGPDHVASLEPEELKEMIKQIREVELMLGKKEKEPTETEKKNRKAARKSIVASNCINRGDVITPKDLIIKRPGTGMSPKLYWELLGKEVTKSYNKDDLIDE